MIKNLNYILAIVCLSISCNLTKKELQFVDAKYQQNKKFFKEEMIDHFPDKIEALPASTILDSNANDNHVFFSLELGNLSNDFLTIIKEQLNKSKTEVYEAKDTSLLVINKFTNKYNVYDQNKFPDNYLYKDTINEKLPVPNFWFPEPIDASTLCKLDSTFKLYVIEAKQDKYWDEKYYTKTNQMPKIWEHGYSKGVAISDSKNVIIYWFAIW